MAVQTCLESILTLDGGLFPNRYTGIPVSPPCNAAFKELIADDHEPTKDRLLRAWTRTTSDHAIVQRLSEDDRLNLDLQHWIVALNTHPRKPKSGSISSNPRAAQAHVGKRWLEDGSDGSLCNPSWRLL